MQPHSAPRSVASFVPSAAPEAEHPAIAIAARDLLALRGSALPLLRSERDLVAREHAKHRLHVMLVAAAQRVAYAGSLPGGEALADALAAVVADAEAAGAFAGYESLRPYVTGRR